MEIDPEQESFVQSVAVKTEGFTKITSDACAQLIAGVTEMLTAYESPGGITMEWRDNKIQIVPPKRPKKLTATRFATVLGLNPWSTPFEIWCEVTRTYQKPFEDTIYTIAGKTIEPKQAQYMKDAYFMNNLVTPTDIYGADYFKKTFGDFFHDVPVFGR